MCLKNNTSAYSNLLTINKLNSTVNRSANLAIFADMKRTIIAMLLLVAITATPAAGKVNTKTQQMLRSYMKTPTFEGSLVGVLALGPKGDTLAVMNPSTRLVPASNMKIITTGAAFRSLGADYKFKTELAYSGKIEDGTLKGDLYIVGYGDPTTASGDSIALSANALFQSWKGMMVKAGIKRVEGAIVGDGRFYRDMREHLTWEYADIGTAYGTGWGGLSFYRNKQDFPVTAGAAAGAPVNVKIKYPDTPWMNFTNRAVTGPAGTGNSLYLYTSDLAPVSELRGTFAVGRKPKTEEYSNKYPDLTLAYYFYKFLTKNGVAVTGGPHYIDADGLLRSDPSQPGILKASDDLKTIGTSWSPKLALIAREINHRSDNFYAEALFHSIGLKEMGTAQYDSCVVAENRVLKSMLGKAAKGIIVEDGSGLSRHNGVSPEAMVTMLKVMASSPDAAQFLATLPSPGSPGTLRRIMANTPEADKSRIRMKSGTLDQVVSYSGYILPEGSEDPAEAVTFCIITNATAASGQTVRAAVLRIIALLLEETKAA